MDLETKVKEVTSVVTEEVGDVVDTVKEHFETQLKKVEEMAVEETKKVAEKVKDLEIRVVEEVMKSKCCLPLGFLFGKYGQSLKPILSKSAETESKVST